MLPGAELAKRFGTLPLAVLAGPAISYARHGFPVSPRIATLWERDGALLARQPGFAEHFLPGGRAPRPGETFKCPAIADSLELIADSGGEAFYRGALAEGIAADAKIHGAALDEADLAGHSADWVDLLALPFGTHCLHELPPNGQGIAVLMAAGMIDALGGAGDGPDDAETIHTAIEAMKLAFADVHRYVADPASMAVPAAALLDPGYLATRAKLIGRNTAGAPDFGAPKAGRHGISGGGGRGRPDDLLHSVELYGVWLGRRGAGWHQSAKPRGWFRARPRTCERGWAAQAPVPHHHSRIRHEASGAPYMAYGVMGGLMQAQGHVQMALRVLRYGQNPQAAADAPRWRVLSGRTIAVEPSIGAATVEALRARGHEVLTGGAGWSLASEGRSLLSERRAPISQAPIRGKTGRRLRSECRAVTDPG